MKGRCEVRKKLRRAVNLMTVRYKHKRVAVSKEGVSTTLTGREGPL